MQTLPSANQPAATLATYYPAKTINRKQTPLLYELIENRTVKAAKQLGLELTQDAIEDPSKLISELVNKKLIVKAYVNFVPESFISHLKTNGILPYAVKAQKFDADLKAEGFREKMSDADMIYHLTKEGALDEIGTAKNPAVDFTTSTWFR